MYSGIKEDPISGVIYWVITAALAVAFFLICRKMGCHFFSGVDYSEKVAGLWAPCVFLASAASTTIVYLFRHISDGLNWWLYLTGVVILVAWLCGLPKLLPWPITADCILGIISANAMYYSVK